MKTYATKLAILGLMGAMFAVPAVSQADALRLNLFGLHVAIGHDHPDCYDWHWRRDHGCDDWRWYRDHPDFHGDRRDYDRDHRDFDRDHHDFDRDRRRDDRRDDRRDNRRDDRRDDHRDRR